jgi:hypothetical protein
VIHQPGGPRLDIPAPGERVPVEDQPPVFSLLWACRSWQAASSRQTHWPRLPHRVPVGHRAIIAASWYEAPGTPPELPPQRIILRRGPVQPHIEQV